MPWPSNIPEIEEIHELRTSRCWNCGEAVEKDWPWTVNKRVHFECDKCDVGWSE